MLLSKEEIEKMDEAYIRSLPPDKLSELAQRLLHTLMNTRKQLDAENPASAPTLVSSDPRVLDLLAKVRRVREESGALDDDDD